MLSKRFTESLTNVIKTQCQQSPIIFYGAGEFAASFSTELEQSNIYPACYSDRDSSKHGSELNGLSILSLDEATVSFSDFFLLITTAPEKWDSISEYLIDSGIPRNKIINKLIIDDNPDLLQWGCNLLFTSIYTWGFNQTYCCTPYNKHFSEIDPNDYDKSASDFLKMRDNVITTLNSGKTHELCQGCPLLKQEVRLYDKIQHFNVPRARLCNFNCSYCYSPNKNGKISKLPMPDYRLLFQSFEKKKVLSDDLTITFATNEITADPDCDEILSIFEDYRLSIATNAWIFNEKIYSILSSSPHSNIIVSMDAGTKETFATIKGRDAWDKVCENIIKYSNSGRNTVWLKYIIIPDINDNETDANGFLDLCAKADVTKILLSNDELSITHGVPLTEKALLTLEYIIKHSKKRGFTTSFIEYYFFRKDYMRLQATLCE